jgi:hypothetical protein
MSTHQIRAIDSLGSFFEARKNAFENNTCVSCGKPAHEFTDALSEKEWKISGLCQVCQDELFAEPVEDDEE